MARRDEKKTRQRAERRGRFSEWFAALYLLLKGYRILALRFRSPAGEVDIIARRGDLVCFIEVKARGNVQGALDAVSQQTQRRIRSTAEIWLSRQPDRNRLSLRFDIVAVVPGKLPRHFPDAF